MASDASADDVLVVHTAQLVLSPQNFMAFREFLAVLGVLGVVPLGRATAWVCEVRVWPWWLPVPLLGAVDEAGSPCPVRNGTPETRRAELPALTPRDLASTWRTCSLLTGRVLYSAEHNSLLDGNGATIPTVFCAWRTWQLGQRVWKDPFAAALLSRRGPCPAVLL